MNSNKWREIARLGREKSKNRKQKSGITIQQEEFCIKYVYGGEFLSIKEWANRFKVCTLTISKWLKLSKIINFIAFLREERKDQIASSCFSRIGKLMHNLEEVAAINPIRTETKGRGKNKREIEITDPDILEQKISAAKTYIEILKGDYKKEKDASTLFNFNVQQNAQQANRAGSPIPLTDKVDDEVKAIEQELRELKALNKDEKLLEDI